MSREASTRRTRKANKESEYGFEFWYQKYQNWVLERQDKKVTYTVLALVVAAALITLASLLPIPQTVQTVIAFPAGIIFFLLPLGLLFIAQTSNPEKPRFKDKVPPSRRRRFAFIGAILLVALFLSSGTILPYALGGSIMVASVLGLYNLARRTPEEMALALAGIPDPRETVVVVEEEEDEVLADTTGDDEFESDSPREA